MTYYEPESQKALFANIWLWIIGSVILTGVIVAGGWRLNWWFAGKAVNYQAHILRNSYANQQTLRDQITQQIGNVLSISTQITETQDQQEIAALKAQRLAVVGIVCQDADEVTGDPLPVDQAQFVQANCTSGVVSPSSAYNQ